MHLERALSDGHHYWSVAKTHREGDKVLKDRVLYLGRLDDLTPHLRSLRESAVLALHDDKVLHAFYAKLAEYGHPVPRASPLLEEGPFPLPPVDFASLCEALRDPDVTHRDVAALVSRMGHPVRTEELAAIGVRADLGEKTRSLFLYYPRISLPHPSSAHAAKGGSRPRRRSDGTPRASGSP